MRRGRATVSRAAPAVHWLATATIESWREAGREGGVIRERSAGAAILDGKPEK